VTSLTSRDLLKYQPKGVDDYFPKYFRIEFRGATGVAFRDFVPADGGVTTVLFFGGVAPLSSSVAFAAALPLLSAYI
jgi:hypothetical protein